MKLWLTSLAVDVLARRLICLSNRSILAHRDASFCRKHGLGYEYLQEWQKYQRLRLAYRRWFPIYTKLREIKKWQSRTEK